MSTIGAPIDVIEPATGQVLARIPSVGVEETDRAVTKAKTAFKMWRNVSAGDRATLLRRIGAAVEEKAMDLARLESRNVGKPFSDALGEMGVVAATFTYYAGAPERLSGKTIPVPGGVDMNFKEPMGVVALITPWNFPLAIASWGVAPALAAGNTVVLKPALLTPLTALELERIELEAGLPEGVFNVVAGPGSVVGERLVEHADVAKITFTGSIEVGKRISARAASRPTSCSRTPTWSEQLPPCPVQSSATPARTAAPAPASWWNEPPWTASWICSQATWHLCRWATRWTRSPRWDP